MGLVARAGSAILAPRVLAQSPVPPLYSNAIQFGQAGSYNSYARAYSGNEIVYACVNLISNSAGEPPIVGRRWRRNKPTVVQAELDYARRGIVNRAGERIADKLLIRDGFIEELPDHPLVTLLNDPNPFMTRSQLWSTVTMDRKLGGNAYLLKVRGKTFGNTAELWRLRPDRVRIIPGGDYIEAFEYNPGPQSQTFRAEDVIHLKERNPYDDYYGMPPLMAAMERIAIDNYMRSFLRNFFEKGGTGPGAVLTMSGRATQESKEEIRERFRRQFSTGGLAGATFEMLILDNTTSSYTQLGLDRGLRDALPMDIDRQNEARIAMIYGIPGSILGLLIGYESSSYANKRQDWQTLWDIVMTPLLKDYSDMLTETLVPEFTGIDEVNFELSRIHALQEDTDTIQERARKNVDAGLWTLEEARLITGVTDTPASGEHLLLPTRSQLVPTPIEDDLYLPTPPTAPALAPPEPPPGGEPTPPPALPPPPAARLLGPGRRSLVGDTMARMLWGKAVELRRRHPFMSHQQVADRIGISRATLFRYRAAFDDGDDADEDEEERGRTSQKARRPETRPV